MGRLLTSIAIFFTLLLGSAFGQTGGRDLYIAKCSACHALDGSGNTTVGRSLKLTDIRPAIKSTPDEQLHQIILEGKGKMLPIKKLDDEKVRSLTLFLRDLAAGNPDAGRAVQEAQAQPLSNVDQVFQNKCSACHAQDGTGRTTIGKSLKIPDLTSPAVQNKSGEQLAEVIGKGRGRMPAYAKTFNPMQVSQFASYILALNKNSSASAPVEGAKLAPAIPTLPSSSPAPASVAAPEPKKSSKVVKDSTAESTPSRSPVTAAKSKSTRQIYIAKCSACHSSDGSGSGSIGKSMRIPSLISPLVQGKTDESLATVISNGIGKMPGYGKKFNSEQIQSLVIYIRELGKK
jgi:mono/diheme cytochrome c family protein